MAEQDMQRIGMTEDDLAMQESRAKRSDQAAAFASWLNSMRMKPDANLPAQLQAAQEKRASNIRKNRTVNMLESAGQTELAKQVASGAITGKTAVQQMFQLAAEERAAGRAAAGRAASFAQQKEIAELQNRLAMERDAAKPLKPSAAQAKVQGLVSTGVPEDVAMGIVYGRLKVVQNPVTGKTNLFDVASNKIIQSDVPEAAANAALDVQSEAGRFEGTDVSQALGLGGWAKGIANVVSDAIGSGQAFPEAGDAAAGLENLQTRTTIMAGIDVAGKPSNFTREEVKRSFTISPSEITTGPAKALQKAQDMVRMLSETYSAAQAAASGQGGATVQQQKDALLNMGTLEGLLRDYKSLETALSRKVNPAPSIAVDPAAIDLMNSLLEPQTVNP